VPPPGIKARVERLWRALSRLKELTSRGLDEFKRDLNVVEAAERNLQVAVEALIDLGEFLIASMNWEPPRSYRDVARILARHGVIEDLEGFIHAVAMRNILVHNYVYVGPEEVYSEAQRLSNTLLGVARSILAYLDRAGVDP